jgi:hypothetical protein
MRPSLLLGLALLVPAASGPPEVPRGFRRVDPGPRRSDERTAGHWRGWVEMTLVGSPLRRALEYRQVVYRQGPGRSPEALYALESTGRVHYRLRDDGLVLVDGVGRPPVLYFPDERQPVTVHLLSPARGLKKTPYRTLDLKDGHASFHGDVLFYARLDRADGYLVGYARIDTARRRVGEQRIVVQVTPNPKRGYEQDAARVDRPEPVRAGDYLFWMNHGWDNKFDRYPVTEPWRTRRTRVIDLRSGKLISGAEVPRAVLERHVPALAPFLQQAANRGPARR